MMTLARRRVRSFGRTGLAALLLTLVVSFHEMSLRSSAFLDGWFLTIGVVFLMLYNWRKKITVLPMLSASAWLQAHVYVGALCALLFLIHTRFSVPNGGLEIALWLLFVTIALSGFVGLALSRHLPARLSARGERLIFERIPALRVKLAEDVRALAVRAAQESGSRAIADYYADHLHSYLRGPRHFWPHLFGHDGPRRQLHREIQDQHRYQDANGRAILNEMETLIVAKNNLDRQHALQFALKIWLFVHIPLTYSMLPLTVVHVALAYAFASGAP